MQLPKNWRKVTGYMIVTCFVVYAAYDLLPATNAVRGDTISEWLRDKSTSMLVPWVAGVLCGHWFWNVHGERTPDPTLTWSVLPAIAILLFLAEIVAGVHAANPAFPFLAGFICGRFFWGQSVKLPKGES